MARVIRWSPRSIGQIKQIGNYIGLDSQIQSKRIVRQIYSSPERVIDNPRLGQIVPELGDDDIREIRVYSYRIIFRFSDDYIDIAAVLHGRQLLDPDSMN